jgi:hypothetical protein
VKKSKPSVWDVEEEAKNNALNSSTDVGSLQPTISIKTGKPKKKVSWAASLEKIHIIIKDESEVTISHFC